MRRTCFICAVVALLMSTLLFAGTKYASIYQNPRAGMIDFSGKKVAAFVIIPDEVFREGREETLAEELRSRGIDCVAGYTVLPGPLVKDRAKAKEFLNKAKISGAVLMRLIGDEERVTASVGAWYSQAYYPSFWGYWGYTWSAVYVPGYTWTDRVITLETAIYSIENDQLLWAGRSETANPKDIKKFVKDLCEAAGKELRKAGLVKK